MSRHPNGKGWETHQDEIVALLGLLGKRGVFSESEVFAMVSALENDDPRTMSEVLREHLNRPLVATTSEPAGAEQGDAP